MELVLEACTTRLHHLRGQVISFLFFSSKHRSSLPPSLITPTVT
jgi:hypothetical protein